MATPQENINKKLEEETLNIKGFITEMDKLSVQVLKSMGQGREMINALSQSMGEILSDVTRLGGSLSEIQKIQSDAVSSLGRNVILNSKVYDDLFAATKVTGKEASEIIPAFKNIGVSVYNAASGVQTIIDNARQLGVNAQEVTAKVLTNIDNINKFNFQGGVDGLAKMAAQATSLRIDMNQTMLFAEKVFNPEGAITAAAALQRLGVTQSQLLDPLRLMDLAQNDPTELQNQIVQMTQQFVRLGESGNFEIMPGAKRQLREISSALNIPYEQLTKMALGSVELEDKMKKITFPDVPEDKKKFIANLAEMGESGKYEVTFYDEQKKETITKAVEALEERDIKYLEKTATPKSLEQLAKEQLEVNKSMASDIKSIAIRPKVALATSSVTLEAVEAARLSTQAINEILSGEKLSIKSLRGGFDDIGNELIKVAKTSLDNPEQGMVKLKELLGELPTKFTKFFDEVKPEIKTRAEKVYDEFETTQNRWIDLLKKGIEKLKGEPQPLDDFDDFAYLPGIGRFEANPQDTFLGFTDRNQQVQKTIESSLLNPLPSLPPQFNFENKQSTTQLTKEDIQSLIPENFNYTGKLDINITAPVGVNPKDLELALKNNLLIEQIISSIKNKQSNGYTQSTVV